MPQYTIQCQNTEEDCPNTATHKLRDKYYCEECYLERENEKEE